MPLSPLTLFRTPNGVRTVRLQQDVVEQVGRVEGKRGSGLTYCVVAATVTASAAAAAA